MWLLFKNEWLSASSVCVVWTLLNWMIGEESCRFLEWDFRDHEKCSADQMSFGTRCLAGALILQGPTFLALLVWCGHSPSCASANFRKGFQIRWPLILLYVVVLFFFLWPLWPALLQMRQCDLEDYRSANPICDIWSFSWSQMVIALGMATQMICVLVLVIWMVMEIMKDHSASRSSPSRDFYVDQSFLSWEH